MGGLAMRPWPRSTGDNVDSYREHSLEATDGDGYSDLLEVQNGGNPKLVSDLPEIMEVRLVARR